MPFNHERLDVYQVALTFTELAGAIVENLPQGDGHIASQLGRAALSIVNNIAEGAGKFAKGEKRRFYLIAAGSAAECAATLDVCARRRLIREETYLEGKELLDRIVAMLVRLAKRR